MDERKATSRVRPARGAVIDIGSNALRLQIVEAGEGGEAVLLSRDRVPVRLGEDVFRSGRIGDAALAAAADALRRFRELCGQYGVQRVRAIATAALREAENREAAVSLLSAAAGVPIEVISGTEEAWLLARAVERRVDTSRGRSLLVDLGGGSAELTFVEEGRAVAAESHPLGAVRLLEAARREAGRDWGEVFLALLVRHAARCDHRIVDRVGSPPVERFVAAGGNVEALADLEAEARGRRRAALPESLEVETLERWITELGLLPPAERSARFGLLPDRADVIVPAAVVYAHLARLSGVSRILVPRVGLRDALLDEVLGAAEVGAGSGSWRETLLASARALAARFHCDLPHAEVVRRHAAGLFERTAGLHGRGAREGALLEAAALLHDAGRFVSTERHHEHSAYLVRASELVGVSAAERELVALVAGYHRGPRPDERDARYAALRAEERARVCVLAALLRLAEALDRQHRGAVAEVSVTVRPGQVELALRAAPGEETGLAIEREAVRERADLFQEVFDVILTTGE